MMMEEVHQPLGEVLVRQVWRGKYVRAAHHTIRQGTVVTLKGDLHPFGLPLKEEPINTGEYTHSPFSNRKKKY